MKVTLTPNAKKQYGKLAKAEQPKVKRKLALLAKNEGVGKKLGGEFAGLRSLRAWPYRIIYRIIEVALEQRIEVVDIESRGQVYKKRR